MRKLSWLRDRLTWMGYTHIFINKNHYINVHSDINRSSKLYKGKYYMFKYTQPHYRPSDIT